MRVVYCGNWGMGLAGLRAAAHHPRVQIARVFTKFGPAGLMNAVCDYARSLELPVTQSAKDQCPREAFHAAMVDACREADLLISCCFDRIFPPEVLRIPRRAAVNVHPSLLPTFRGEKPLENALVQGAPVGVTIHLLAEALDAGDILLQDRLPAVAPDATLAEVFDRQNALAGRLLRRFLDDPSGHLAARRPQDAAAATPAPRLAFATPDTLTIAELRARAVAVR